MKKRKIKRYEEGGAMPDIDREPLRDSSGEIVRDSSGEAIMSGSTRARQSGPKGYLDDDIRPPEGIQASQRKPPPSLVGPSRVTSEYDNLSGLDVAPGMGNRKPLAKPPARPSVTPPASPIKPASGGGRGTAAGPTAAQLEEGRKKFAEDQGRRNLERLQKEDKPLERVNPEASLMGGPALRGAKAMATGLREFGEFAKQRMARSAAPSAVKQLGQSGRQAENLTKDMGPVEFAAGKRSMLQNQRGEGVITPPAAPFAERNKRMLMQNQRGEGVITPPAPVRPPRGGGRDPEARRPTRDELDKMRMGSDYMRKGGKVKAHKSGGSVSSASKRADGIAMRGKTRGKYI